jgi:hypothetical protein
MKFWGNGLNDRKDIGLFSLIGNNGNRVRSKQPSLFFLLSELQRFVRRLNSRISLLAVLNRFDRKTKDAHNAQDHFRQRTEGADS